MPHSQARRSRFRIRRPSRPGIAAGRYSCRTASPSSTSPARTRRTTSSKSRRPAGETLTDYKDDGVAFPCASQDGKTVVFRHLFDLYALTPGGKPAKIDIVRDDDRPDEHVARRTLTSASAWRSPHDGLEIAFIAGGDLWVMDTELREPKQRDGHGRGGARAGLLAGRQSVFFVSDAGGQTDVWKAERGDAKKPWWLNDAFKLDRVTDDGEAKTALSFSPDGSKFAYVKGRGDLVVADADGKNAKTAVESWNGPAYDWSPDGKWLVYALDDDDFNGDIWIKPLDGSKPPFNLSRHPYNEGDPVWSPDGRVIAFTGDRERKDDSDIFFVYLRAEDDQKNARDRNLEKAVEKYVKGKLAAGQPKKAVEDADDEPAKPELGPPPRARTNRRPRTRRRRRPSPRSSSTSTASTTASAASPSPNSTESDLFWSPDSKKLAFSATVDGQAGTFYDRVAGRPEADPGGQFDRLEPALARERATRSSGWGAGCRRA